MAIELEKVQHVKNIKYKGLHPIDKKKTIKKINDLIDKFNRVNGDIYDDTQDLCARFTDNSAILHLFKGKGLGEVNRDICLSYMWDVLFRMKAFREYRHNCRVKEFNNFLKSITTNSSNKIDFINKEVDSKNEELNSKEPDGLKNEELRLARVKFSKLVDDMFKVIKVDLFNKQNSKLKEVDSFIKKLIDKFPKEPDNDSLKLKAALVNVKSVISKKAGKISNDNIEILNKHFGVKSIRGWNKRGIDAIKEKYDLPMISGSDSDTKDIIFSFMAIMIDGGMGGVDGVWDKLGLNTKK